tara:strand:- start:1383 stop:2195 length:813 start_codon:yes stop_codon:yes gene_type:complete
MKNLIPILLAVVVLSSGCDPDGYSCNSEGCYADDDSPQYQTLEDCLSVCDEITPTPENCGDLVSHDGYDYSTVQIGDQCWFSENCRYLPEVSNGFEFSETEPYYYVYDYQGTDVEAAQATENYETYGALYNWPAVMTEGICPSGWHIPLDEEFTELKDFLGGLSVAGGKVKETGLGHWNSPNTATNSSGWTGLPGGHRYGGQPTGYLNLGVEGNWWSASEASNVLPGGPDLTFKLERKARVRKLIHYTGIFYHASEVYRDYGFSARCVRD